MARKTEKHQSNAFISVYYYFFYDYYIYGKKKRETPK